MLADFPDNRESESRESLPVIANTQHLTRSDPDADTSLQTNSVAPACAPGPQPSHDAIVSVRPRRRKANVLNLNACICGITITDHEIQDGENVMKCRVPGCKTVWVSGVLTFFQTLLITYSLSSISHVWTMSLYHGSGLVSAVGLAVAVVVISTVCPYMFFYFILSSYKKK